MEEQEPSAGGYGGDVEYPTRSMARIERQAVKGRWDIPDKYKDGIVNRQVQIAISPESSNREATSAAKCILSMEGQNQTDEHHQDKQDGNRLRAVAMLDYIRANGSIAGFADSRAAAGFIVDGSTSG